MKRWGIAPKIFFITFICFQSVLLLLGFFFYRHASSSLVYAQTEYAKLMVQKSDEYLSLNLKNVQSSLISIANDSRFQSQEFAEIEGWLVNNVTSYIPNIRNIHLVGEEDILISTSNYSWTLMENDTLMDYVRQLNHPNEIYWFGPYYSLASQHTLSAAMLLPAAGEDKKVLLLDLDINDLFNALIPANTDPSNGEMLLLDMNGQTIYGRKPFIHYDVFTRTFIHTQIDPAIFTQGWIQTQVELQDGANLFLTRSRGNMLGWQIVWIMDQTELLKPLRPIITLSWLLGLCSIFLSAIVSWFISLYIGKPIKYLAQTIRQFSKGKLNIQFHTNRQDELGMLAMHFNAMTKRIQALITELKIKEEEKKKSDFRALHAQIKPHFLYNTLNTISIAGREGQLETMDLLISSLTSQLHYTLDSSPQPVALRDEITALEHYLDLMQHRYPGKFNCDFDLDPLTLEYTLPKFIIQPIAENAIFHGLVPRGEPGCLFIASSVEGDFWELMIEDNGIGMSAEQTRRITGMLQGSAAPVESKASEHIGLRNVHERLTLMFGESYSLQLDSAAGQGTQIILRFPLRRHDRHEEER